MSDATTERRDDAPDGGEPRSVIDRAFAILGTFRGGHLRQTLSEISRATGLPIATCYRIVQRLVEWGALERDSEGKYRIGLRLWEVASLAPRSVGLQRLARPYMQDLYETTGYATHLAVREGTELVLIERFQSPRRSVRRPLVGHRYALHATAIGQVLLAHAPPEVQEEVLSGTLASFTPRTITDRETLERSLADVHRNGYAVSDREIDDVHISLASPVRGPDGTVVAAVSLSLTKEDVDSKNMIHLVRITATSISRSLGAAHFGD